MNGERRRPSWSDRGDAVRSIPLEDILLQCGGRRDHRDRHRWVTERGPISVTGSRFMNWRDQSGGGGAIDLVMHLIDLSFTEAVEWLEHNFIVASPAPFLPSCAAPSGVPSRPAHSLRLPPPVARELERVSCYLTNHRHLRRELVSSLVERKAFYADASGNAVFLMERGKSRTPVGAELRGTTAARWRGLAPGSCKDSGYFWVGEGSAHRIVLCESAIDAISCYQLLGGCICISTAGARSDARWLPALLRRGYEVHNGFDDDEAGHSAASAMRQTYPVIQRLIPPAKDWNLALHRWG